MHASDAPDVPIGDGEGHHEKEVPENDLYSVLRSCNNQGRFQPEVDVIIFFGGHLDVSKIKKLKKVCSEI